MGTSKFRLKLAHPDKETRYFELSFRAHMERDAAESLLYDPVIAEVCGDALDYGRLFAYCFRRFGYPNVGWDAYKELAAYYLTTPRSDMLLSLVPYVGDTAVNAVRFLVPMPVYKQIEDYVRQPVLDWQARALAWRATRALPAWMPEWLAYYNGEFRAAAGLQTPVVEDWQACVNFSGSYGEAGSRMQVMTQRVADFYRQLIEDYAKIEPSPGFVMRAANWRDWPEEDPLKRYAEAALVALEDLRRPVAVRDESINAFGLTEWTRGCATPAPAAGYPAGALANAAPEDFATLHALIMRLGKGNAKRGIAKVLAATETLS